MTQSYFRQKNGCGRTLVVLTIIFTALVFPHEIFADNGRKVVFQKGKTSVTYRGKLPRETAEYFYYLIKAKKGQTLSVRLDAEAPGAQLAIYEAVRSGPMDDVILSYDLQAREWSGQLPLTSEYSIQVYNEQQDDAPRRGGPYTLTISLK